MMVHADTFSAYNTYPIGAVTAQAFFHEATHVSLDNRLYGTADWDKAVADDGKYVSDHARDNPGTEDIAETYLVWFSTRYSPDTFTEEELK